jgi:hypothetical protein
MIKDPTRQYAQQFSMFVRKELLKMGTDAKKAQRVNELCRELEEFISGKVNRAADFLFTVRHQCFAFEDDPLRSVIPLLDNRQLAEDLLRQIRRTINSPSYQHQSQIANKRTGSAKMGGNVSTAKSSSRKRATR